jgi:hypothetical protein
MGVRAYAHACMSYCLHSVFLWVIQRFASVHLKWVVTIPQAPSITHAIFPNRVTAERAYALAAGSAHGMILSGQHPAKPTL